MMTDLKQFTCLCSATLLFVLLSVPVWFSAGPVSGMAESGQADDSADMISLMEYSPLLAGSPSFTVGGGQERPVIGVAGIWHESNSFSSRKTTLEDFAPGNYLGQPEDYFERANMQTIAAGYIEGARQYGLELFPTVSTGAIPMGPVTDHAFETLMEQILDQLQNGPELDGILLDLHGAMVVESFPSGDAEFVRRVRETFGPEMPIVVTHDFHANITPEIVEDSDVLITYKENPHVDTFDRGVQAAQIMAGMVRGEIRPTQTIEHPPMVYNIVFQNTFREPLLPVTSESKRIEEDERILAVSVAGGYQYADVEWMGPSVVVVTNNEPQLAARQARRLSDMLWETRDQLELQKPEPAEAVRQAMEHDGRPVLLIDMGDNIGGGSAGDSTHLLEELIRQEAGGWVIVLADPEAYEQAVRSGIGGEFDALVGGKTDDMHGDPVRIRGEVRSLHVGRYLEPEVRHGGGRYWNMGHTAVIHLEGSPLDEPNLVVLTTRRSSPNSIHQLVSNGIYVERQKIIVAKGAIAPRAAYEPVASLLIPVDSPGATAVNTARFDYKNVREGLFGLGNQH